MNRKNCRRKYITLIEIIVVMMFITIITGIVAYNVKGALDEGKAFRTVESMKQLRNILELELSSDYNAIEKIKNGEWKDIIAKHPLVKNAKNLVKDGWGKEFKVYLDDSDSEMERIVVESDKFKAYQKDHATLFKDDE